MTNYFRATLARFKKFKGKFVGKNFIVLAVVMLGYTLLVQPAFPQKDFLNVSKKLSIAFSPSPIPQRLILEKLKSARRSIEISMFIITDDSIVNALCYLARKRRVKIKMLIDETRIDDFKDMLLKLSIHGVSIHKENHRGKTHTKLAIIDDKVVLTGSYNWTLAAWQFNFEDLLIFNSPEIAQHYKTELAKIFEFSTTLKFFHRDYKGEKVRKFPDFTELTREQKKSVFTPGDGKKLNVFFPPNSDGKEKLLSDIKSAEKSLTVAMYLFLDSDILSAILAKTQNTKNESFAIEVILGDDEINEKTYKKIADAGIKVRKIGDDETGLMHFKSVVIDKKITWTGSANWTYAGLSLNFEDLIRIESVSISKLYSDYIENKIKTHSDYN